MRRYSWWVRAVSGGNIFSRNTEAVSVGPRCQVEEIIILRVIRRNFLCVRPWTQLSASPRTVHFRCMSVVDHVDHATPRAPGRWTTARPRKGTTRRQGRLDSCFPRGREYDCTRVYWFVCCRQRITTCVGLWVSRGMARPAMGVRWGGEACAAAQSAAGRRQQAVPPALV